MNGTSHMVISAMGYALTAPILTPMVSADPFTGGMLVAGTVIAAGGGLIADLDTPMSKASQALPPITPIISKILTPLMGGHRYGTHSVFATIGIWYGTAALIARYHQSFWVMLLVTSILCLFAVKELVGDRLQTHFTLLAAVVAGLACLGISASGAWMVWAVTIGYALHLAADAITTEGIRVLWPLTSKSFGPRLFDGDSLPARGVTQVCGLVLIGALALQLVIPAVLTNYPQVRQIPQQVEILVGR